MKTFHLCLLLTLFALLFFGCETSDDDDSPSSGSGADDDDTVDDDDDDDDNDDNDNDDNDDDEQYDPSLPGPFEVGNATYVFVDESRDDPGTQAKRTLVTEVWYPAADEAANMPRDILRNFFGQWDDDIMDNLADEGIPPEELANFDQETGSARDAPINTEHGPYPIIVFSHGNAGVRFQNWVMCEYLASHGFIVIAPDHTGNALVAPLPDEPFFFDENLVFISYWQRKGDLSFLITVFSDLQSGDTADEFIEQIDPDKVGAAGHSFGGTAAIEATRDDHRITATINMASFMFPWGADNFNAALMFAFGLEDNTMSTAYFLFRFDYAIANPPKFKLEFKEGGHYTFTDVCLLIPTFMGDEDGCGSGEHRWTGVPFDYIDHDESWAILNPYFTAFYGYNLRNEQHMKKYLEQNHAPDVMNYEQEM